MKRRRDAVLDGGFYHVGSESCAQSFPESRDSASIISWVAEHLSDSGLHDHAAAPHFSDDGLLPVLPVRMRFLPRLLDRRVSRR